MRNVETQYNIGQMYYDDGGVEQNYKTDIEWFREASVGGNGEAKNTLGECYGGNSHVLYMLRICFVIDLLSV